MDLDIGSPQFSAAGMFGALVGAGIFAFIFWASDTTPMFFVSPLLFILAIAYLWGIIKWGEN